MKIPTYENQVAPAAVNAARPKAVEPVAGAFGEKLAQAGSNLATSVGRTAGEASAAAQRLETRKRNLRLTSAQLNWQKDNDEILNGKIGSDGKRIDGGLLTKQYSDADEIASLYAGRKQELMDKHLSAANTPEEYEELRLYFEKDFQSNFDRVAQYQLKQQRATSDLLTQAFTQDALKKIADNPETLKEQLPLITQKEKDNWVQNGIPADVQKISLYELTGRAVSAAVGSLLEQNLPQRAADVLNENHDNIDTKTGQVLAKQVRAAVVNNLKSNLWNEASKTRTATGEVDFNYARRIVAATGLEADLQAELVKYLDARMADEKRIKEQENRAKNENFYAAADELVSGNGTLEQGLKLAAQYASDSKDKFTKEKFIRSLFEERSGSGRAASDPEEYLRLWKAVSDGTATENDVRDSFNRGQINATDYRGLAKECYKTSDDKQGTAFALKQIEADAKKKIDDSGDLAVFMLEVKRQSKGKSPEEMVSIATSLLQKSGGWFSDEKYKQSAALNLEQQRVMGDYMRKYPDGGKYVKMIISALFKEKDNASFEWSEKDVDSWVKRFGGQKLFTEGTPENDAINWLTKNNIIPTTEDMEYAIDFFYTERGKRSPRALRESVNRRKAEEAAASLAAQKRIINGINSFIDPMDR